MNLSMLNVLPWIEWIAASRFGQAISTAPPITASASKWIDSMTANAHVDALMA